MAQALLVNGVKPFKGMPGEGELRGLQERGVEPEPLWVMVEEAYGFTVSVRGWGQLPASPAVFLVWTNALEKRVGKAFLPG